jgi:hypothetical protein
MLWLRMGECLAGCSDLVSVLQSDTKKRSLSLEELDRRSLTTRREAIAMLIAHFFDYVNRLKDAIAALNSLIILN